jgi:predicted DNA-binding protein YlxM (UPF0122 family)
MSNFNGYLTVADIAEKYSISRQAVYKWIDAGLIYSTVCEIGKKPYKLISIENLNYFLKNRGAKDETR